MADQSGTAFKKPASADLEETGYSEAKPNQTSEGPRVAHLQEPAGLLARSPSPPTVQEAFDHSWFSLNLLVTGAHPRRQSSESNRGQEGEGNKENFAT